MKASGTTRGFVTAVALSLATSALALWVADVLIARQFGRTAFESVRDAALAAGRPFDARTQLTVVKELHNAGFPAAAPYFNVSDAARAMELLGMPPGYSPIVPLSGRAHARTVNCNESGEWSWYDADRHGFNNPDSAWLAPDLVLLGDSFVHGQCVRSGDELAALFRLQGRRTLSLGYAGNGPLASLATFVEYARPLRPKFVVWFIFDNDVGDLLGEISQSYLRRYFDGEDTGLIHRPAERDALLDRLLAAVVDSGLILYPAPDMSKRVRSVLTLFHLRELVRSTRDAGHVPDHGRRTIRQVLKRARDETASWGGELFVVHLPAWEHFKYPSLPLTIPRLLEEETSVLNVPYLDATEAIAAPEPWGAFAQGSLVAAHYSPQGYERVSTAVGRWLEDLARARGQRANIDPAAAR